MKKNLYILLGLILSIILLNACSYLAKQDLSGTFRVISKDCVGCNDCNQVCPVKAINLTNGKAVIDQTKCIKCGLCEQACTYTAIRKLK